MENGVCDDGESFGPDGVGLLALKGDGGGGGGVDDFVVLEEGDVVGGVGEGKGGEGGGLQYAVGDDEEAFVLELVGGGG